MKSERMKVIELAQADDGQLQSASSGRRLVAWSRGRLCVFGVEGRAVRLERELAIDDDAEAVGVRGDTAAWLCLSSQTHRAVNLVTGAFDDAPTGWVGSPPVFLGEREMAVASKATRHLALSPDGEWLVATQQRPDIDVVFSTASREEVKAFPKGARVLGISDAHVVIAVKKGWQLVTTHSWKKVAEGSPPEGPRMAVGHAVFSPGGRWVALQWFPDAPLVVIDARTGVEVGRCQPETRNVSAIAWVDGGVALLGSPPTVVWLSLPDADDSVELPQLKTTKKARTTLSRSAALGLPFELEWSCPESELKKIVKAQRTATYDAELAKLEAMIFEPTFRTVTHRDVPIAHAAALLLRNPESPARIEAALGAHADDPHVLAVLPLLKPEARRRLAIVEALAGRPLDAEQRRAVTQEAVAVWARATGRKLPLSSPALSAESPFSRLMSVIELYGDRDALAAELRALWRDGLARTLDFVEEELDVPFAEFWERALANVKAAPAAFAHRYESARFATDAPSEVRPRLEALMRTPAMELQHAHRDAHRAALAYGMLALDRVGERGPDIGARIAGRITSVLLARAAIAVGAPSTPNLAPWQTALAGRWSELPTALLAAVTARVEWEDLAVVAAYAAKSVPEGEAERLARELRGCGWGADRAAFSIFLRLRDAGKLDESPSWFQFEARTPMPYPLETEAERALAQCSEATRTAALEDWFARGVMPMATAKVDFERTFVSAIRRGDIGVVQNLKASARFSTELGLTEAQVSRIPTLLLEHIAECPRAEELARI